MPTATIQMKNSAIDRTSEIFSADQVSMWRSCSRARRGPRPPPRADPRPRTPRAPPALVSVAAPLTALLAAAGGTAADPPVAGGTGGAPGGPPVGWPAGGPPVGWPAGEPTAVAPPAARWLPVVGIAWVAEAGAGAAEGVGAASSP